MARLVAGGGRYCYLFYRVIVESPALSSRPTNVLLFGLNQ